MITKEEYIAKYKATFPYVAPDGTPFRLERESDHEWKVITLHVENDYGVSVGFHEKEDYIDDCDTEQEAVKVYQDYIQQQMEIN